MNMIINKTESISNLLCVKAREDTANRQTVAFKDLMLDALENVNSLEQESAKITEDFIAGRTDDIHNVMIAAEKASISLQFIMEVRNKVMDAYQEIMRMQI
jgi:flagellar hook-basal body complex protein FliE